MHSQSTRSRSLSRYSSHLPIPNSSVASNTSLLISVCRQIATSTVANTAPRTQKRNRHPRSRRRRHFESATNTPCRLSRGFGTAPSREPEDLLESNLLGIKAGESHACSRPPPSGAGRVSLTKAPRRPVRSSLATRQSRSWRRILLGSTSCGRRPRQLRIQSPDHSPWIEKRSRRSRKCLLVRPSSMPRISDSTHASSFCALCR